MIVIPVKSFGESKFRLSPVLSAQQRASLARTMAESVVRAAGYIKVAIVTADADVSRWAKELGCSVLADPGLGLNRAVQGAASELFAGGASEVIVAHGDLPMASDLTGLCNFDGITLVPDRRGDGTNVIAFPAGSGFQFSYGPGSFRRHLAEAVSTGLTVRTLSGTALGWDVDLPEDIPTDFGIDLDSEGLDAGSLSKLGPFYGFLPDAPSVAKSGLPVVDLLDSTTKTVNLRRPGTVLAIGAQPDDIASARASEQIEAAKCLGGGDVEFLGCSDGELESNVVTRRQVCEAIRRLKPDCVIGHDPWRRYRLHPDHRQAGLLTTEAIVAARDPGFFSDIGPAPHRPSSLLLFEADEPNHLEVLDPAHQATKVRSLLAHASQYKSTMGIEISTGSSENELGSDRSPWAELSSKVHRHMSAHGAIFWFRLGEAFRLIDDL